MPPRRQHVSDRPPVGVERVATIPMTHQHYQQAVTSLAVLITAWQNGHAEPGPGSGLLASPSRPGERH